MLQDILNFLADNLLGQMPILIGLIALVGLLLQRKPVEDVIGGTLRSAIGVVIMTIGIDVFVGGLVSFQAIVSSAVGSEPPTATSSLNDFLVGAGASAPLIIAFGFILHLIVVRLFPAAHYVYLTGHLMLWMSIVVAATLVEVFGVVDRWTLVGVGAVIVAAYWTLQPLWTAPLMKRLMGHDMFGLGHTTSTLALATGYGAKALKLGDPEKHDTEKLEFPKSITFLKDMNVATAALIAIIMTIALIFADNDVVSATVGDDTSPYAWGILQALRFAGGLAVLMFGVRMFLAEIVPAFKGISDKLLPGSRPALDLPVIFPKGQTAVIVGFLASTVTFLIMMGVFAAFNWFVLVPPMIMLFFGGGCAGVFGNNVAGWRGAVFGGVLNGLILAFGQWISWGLYDNTAPELATLADPDWYAVGWLLFGLSKVLNPLGGAGIWLVAAIVAVLLVVVLLALGRRVKTAQQVSEDAVVAE